MACDLPKKETAPAEQTASAEDRGPIEEATAAEENAPTPSTPAANDGSAEPAPEPAPTPPVEADDAPQSAAAALEKALPAVAPTPGDLAALLEATEKRAWEHTRGFELYEAGEAFATLTKLDREAWKHPFNAACMAAVRRDYTRAQVFLVEALRRGGQEARAKAERDEDLSALRPTPWWSDLLAADAESLAAWMIRDTPVHELARYGAGESPLAIRDVKVSSGGWTSIASSRLSLSFEAEKLASTGSLRDFEVTAVCKVDDRYLATDSLFFASDKELPTGSKQRFDLELHQYLMWPRKQTFDHCELRFLALDADVHQPGRIFAELCFVGGRVEGRVDEGPCTDFRRTPAAEPRVVEVIADPPPPTTGKGSWALKWYVELDVGPGPLDGEEHQVAYECEVAGARVHGRSMLFAPGEYHLREPGESMQLNGEIRLASEPTRCQIEVQRFCCGPEPITGIPAYCYTAGKVEAKACSWD